MAIIVVIAIAVGIGVWRRRAYMARTTVVTSGGMMTTPAFVTQQGYPGYPGYPATGYTTTTTYPAVY